MHTFDKPPGSPCSSKFNVVQYFVFQCLSVWPVFPAVLVQIHNSLCQSCLLKMYCVQQAKVLKGVGFWFLQNEFLPSNRRDNHVLILYSVSKMSFKDDGISCAHTTTNGTNVLLLALWSCMHCLFYIELDSYIHVQIIQRTRWKSPKVIVTLDVFFLFSSHSLITDCLWRKGMLKWK